MLYHSFLRISDLFELFTLSLEMSDALFCLALGALLEVYLLSRGLELLLDCAYLLEELLHSLVSHLKLLLEVR